MLRKITSIIIILCFAVNSISFAVNSNDFNLSAPSKLTSKEFQHAAQIEVGIRHALKNVQDFNLQSLQNIGQSEIIRESIFQEKIDGTIFFDEAQEIEINGESSYSNRKNICLRSVVGNMEYVCLISEGNKKFHYDISVVPLGLYQEAKEKKAFTVLHDLLDEKTRSILDAYVGHEISTENSEAIDPWIMFKMQSGEYVVDDVTAWQNPHYSKALKFYNRTHYLRIIESIIKFLKTSGVKNTEDIRKTLLSKPLVFIPYRDAKELPRIKINGIETYATAHSSHFATYIFVPYKILNGITQKKLPLVTKLYIEEILVHEVGAICGLRASLENGVITNVLDHAFRQYKEQERAKSFKLNPKIKKIIEDIKPVNLIELELRNDYADGITPDEESIFKRLIHLLIGHRKEGTQRVSKSERTHINRLLETAHLRYPNPRDPHLELDEYDREHFYWDKKTNYWRSKDYPKLVLGTWEDVKNSQRKNAAPTDMENHVAIRMEAGYTIYIFDSHSRSIEYYEDAERRGEIKRNGNQQIWADDHPDTFDVVGDRDARIALDIAKKGWVDNHVWVYFNAEESSRGKNVLKPNQKLLDLNVQNSACHFSKYREVSARPVNTRAIINIDTDVGSYEEVAVFIRDIHEKDGILPSTIHINTSPPNVEEDEGYGVWQGLDGFVYTKGFGTVERCHELALSLPLIFSPESFEDREKGRELDTEKRTIAGEEITVVTDERIDHELISPVEAVTPKKEEEKLVEYLTEKALSRGQVGIITVAGGMSSRAGLQYPKGMHKITPLSDKSLFESRAEEILAVKEKYGKTIPWFIMTSSVTDKPTRDYFRENNFFGLGEENVIFVMQDNVTALLSGTVEVAMKDKDTPLKTPNGHGGVYKAMRNAEARTDGATISALEEARKRGVRAFLYCQVDNPLPVVDSNVLGYHLMTKSDFTTVLVRKRNPEEGLAMMAEDIVTGERFFVEYNQPAAELIREKDGYENGSISRLAFSYRFLADAPELPYRMAREKTADIYKDGEIQKGKIDKFESFVFEALHSTRMSTNVILPREVCFAPFKRMEGEDSPETVKEAISRLHKKWLRESGVTSEISEESVVEFSPFFTTNPEDVQYRIYKNFSIKGNSEVYLGGQNIRIGENVSIENAKLYIEFEDPKDGSINIRDGVHLDPGTEIRIRVKKGEHLEYTPSGIFYVSESIMKSREEKELEKDLIKEEIRKLHPGIFTIRGSHKADIIAEILWKYATGKVTEEEIRSKLIKLLPELSKGLEIESSSYDTFITHVWEIMMFMSLSLPGKYEKPDTIDIESVASRIKEKDIEVFMPVAQFPPNTIRKIRKVYEKKFGGKLRVYKSIPALEGMIENPGKSIVMTAGLSKSQIDKLSRMKIDLQKVRFMNFERVDTKQMSESEHENYIAETLSILLVARTMIEEDLKDKASPIYRMFAYLLEGHIEDAGEIENYIETIVSGSLDPVSKLNYVLKTILKAVPITAYKIMKPAVEVLWSA